MRSIETRVKRLEAELGDKPSAVQFLIVPREVPWEKWDEYIRDACGWTPPIGFP